MGALSVPYTSTLAMLPLVAFTLLLLAARAAVRVWSHAALAAAVLWAALLVAITELLSATGALRPGPLAAAWALACLVVLVAWAGVGATGGRDWWPAWGSGESRWPQPISLTLAPVLGGTLVTAVVAAPNSWDAMTYHLPRVQHWIQNGSVAHYPTHNLHQLFMGPLASWAMLHLELLFGSDRLVNLVSWSSLAGSVIAAVVIARELGAGRRGRWWSALFGATVPMAVLQASSALNDLVAAFWSLAAVALLFRWRRRAGVSDALFAGLAVGLVALCKVSALFFVAPVAVWVAASLLRRRSLRLVGVLLAALLALLSNLGHLARNDSVFGHPLGPERTRRGYVSSDLGPDAVASGMIRNGATLAATPWHRVNGGIEAGVRLLHGVLGRELQHPESTYLPQRPFELSGEWRGEFRTGAPLHLVLLGIAAVGLATRRERDDDSASLLAPYAVALAAGFVLFSAVLRWQPDNARLLLPCLMLWSPWFGTAVERRSPGRTASVLLVSVLLAAALPRVLFNENRPLIGERSVLRTSRSEQYFAQRSFELEYLDRIVRRLDRVGCQSIGLLSRFGSFEYPVWALTASRFGHRAEIRHVGVENESTHLAEAAPPFSPCAVLLLFGGQTPPRLNRLDVPSPEPDRLPPAAGAASGSLER